MHIAHILIIFSNHHHVRQESVINMMNKAISWLRMLGELLLDKLYLETDFQLLVYIFCLLIITQLWKGFMMESTVVIQYLSLMSAGILFKGKGPYL